MNKNLLKSLSAINYGYKRKIVYVDVPKTSLSISLLVLLKQEGFISNFIANNLIDLSSRNVRVFLLNSDLDEESSFCYFNKKKHCKFFNASILNTLSVPPYQELQIFSKPNKLFFCSVKKLKFLSNINNIIILSTTFGLITDKLAIELNVGGIILCIFKL